MAFPAEILRAGIKIADKLTKGAQGTVTHYPFQSQDVKGKVTYGTSASLRCVIDYTRKQVQTGGGRSTWVIATLTFVGDVVAIDTRDKIVLPDGRTGPIITTPNAVVDPGTGRGFVNELMIGDL